MYYMGNCNMQYTTLWPYHMLATAKVTILILETNILYIYLMDDATGMNLWQYPSQDNFSGIRKSNTATIPPL